MDTHSRLVAAATAFGGKKDKIYDPFIERLTEATNSEKVEKRTISMAELAKMGRELLAEQADETEEQRLDREAKDAALMSLFAKHKDSAARIA